MNTNKHESRPAGFHSCSFVFIRGQSDAMFSFTKLAIAIATWFGCGYSPVAPGTAGSLAAVAIAYILAQWAHWRPFYFALLALALLPVGIWSAGVTAREVKKKDPSIVVVDEVLGQWITLAGASSFNWKSWLAAGCWWRPRIRS